MVARGVADLEAAVGDRLDGVRDQPGIRCRQDPEAGRFELNSGIDEQVDSFAGKPNYPG